MARKHFPAFFCIMPSFGVYLPEGSPLALQIEQRAKRDHDGKVSAYVRAAIERDIESDGAPAFPSKKINLWIDDEIALLEANRYALIYLYDKTEGAREAAALGMAETITRAVVRRPPLRGEMESLPLASESPQSPYHPGPSTPGTRGQHPAERAKELLPKKPRAPDAAP